jgi:hypothetical protein
MTAPGLQGGIANDRFVEFNCENLGLADRPLRQKLTGRNGHFVDLVLP